MPDVNADPETKENHVLHDLAADLAALREDFSKLSASMRDLLQNQASATGRRMYEAVDEARQKLTDEMAGAKDHLETRLGTVSADLETTIQRNPLVAVVIGAAVGYVIGLVSRPHK